MKTKTKFRLNVYHHSIGFVIVLADEKRFSYPGVAGSYGQSRMKRFEITTLHQM